MTLLTLGRRRANAAPPLPDAPPRAIDSSSPRVFDMGNAVTVVTAAMVPGGADEFREQDDVVWDPDGPDSYLLYFTITMGGVGSFIWRTTSDDGATWSTPEKCTVAGGGDLVGQDPSLVQTFGRAAPRLHRHAGRMWMYCENNATSVIDCYSSADGVVWTLEQAGAIPRGGPVWDGGLTGSPIARFDGANFIVGYEGIGNGGEALGLSIGPTPTQLAKHPHNPVWVAGLDGLTVDSIVADSMWMTGDGSHVIITAHDGTSTPPTEWRGIATNTDPTTWQSGDIALIGGQVHPTLRNDLTAFTHHGGYMVFVPDNEPSSILLVPLVAP